jgi:hypothetical protein
VGEAEYLVERGIDGPRGRGRAQDATSIVDLRAIGSDECSIIGAHETILHE